MTTPAASSYLTTAFQSQYNLILLGGSALFSLASASLVPFAAGCAAELCWLGLGSRLPAFRRRVDARLENERRAKLDDEVMLGMRSLDPEHMARLRALDQSVALLVLQADSAALSPEDRGAWTELERLRPGLLRYCKLDQRLRHRLEEMQLAPPDQEAARLSRAYAAEKDLGARLTLHQGVKLARRRAEQQARMVEGRRQIELALSTTEQALAYLHAQLRLGAPLPELLPHARELTSSLSQAATLEAQLLDAAQGFDR